MQNSFLIQETDLVPLSWVMVSAILFLIILVILDICYRVKEF